MGRSMTGSIGYSDPRVHLPTSTLLAGTGTGINWRTCMETTEFMSKYLFELDDSKQISTVDDSDREVDHDEMASNSEPTLYLAGHLAPVGTYRMFGRSREVHLEAEGILPASLDGRVAVYQRRGATWAERQDHNNDDEMANADSQDALNESFPAV